ncbi:MAG: LytTR family transcriptional regulator DNA-binding domain-containing protein [Lachnospiraceae bacterium]|nr:LytTR family transcriptional regulator DNA-binding domain-containing protein [Lachnospiraceae bacterium]
MKNMVDIDVVINEEYVDPKVTIETKARTGQVENIIYAIENASENEYPQVVGYIDDTLMLISQRDVYRIFIDGRKVILQTEDSSYVLRKSLSSIEEDLNPDRFIRISQSEIANMYKVKCFDISTAGTIGIEFDNGVKSWASRSRVRQIKDFLKRK